MEDKTPKWVNTAVSPPEVSAAITEPWNCRQYPLNKNLELEMFFLKLIHASVNRVYEKLSNSCGSIEAEHKTQDHMLV